MLALLGTCQGANPSKRIQEWRSSPEYMDLDHLESFEKFQDWFLPSLANATRCVVFDVGANNGEWTKSVQRLSKRNKSKNYTSIEFHVFEPQPKFAEPLQQLARGQWKTYVNQAAVWHDDTKNLTFFLSRSSISASLKPVMAYTSGVPRRGPTNVSVRAVNLAQYMSRVLPPLPRANETLAVLKLDVESAEFELLPYLISTGILCRVHMLLIEWHLNALPPPDRIAGLGLRLTLSSVLRRGCSPLHPAAVWTGGVPGPQMIHEGAPINNWEQQVPGLWDVALFHNGTPVPGQEPSKRVRLFDHMRSAIESGAHLRGHRSAELPTGVLPGRR